MVVGGWDELLDRAGIGGAWKKGREAGRERMGKELGNGKGWQASGQEREGGTSTRARLLQRWSVWEENDKQGRSGKEKEMELGKV